MANSANTLKFLRKLHLYIGVFISPALLFFAVTGAMQTFSLHETKGRADYTPPKWIVTLAQIHKNQTAVVPVKKPAAPGIAGAAAAAPKVDAPKAPAPPKKSHLPEKVFFLVVAVGLFTSTLTGIYMAYKYERNKVLVTVLWVLGIVVPVVLLPF